MIPPFDEKGFLPPGVHLAPITDIDRRFGHQSDIRRAQMDSVRWMIDLATRAGAERIVLNGSFATDTIEPNDVDCVLLFPSGASQDAKAMEELMNGLPFLDILMVGAKDFEYLVHRFFASDRLDDSKGMIEVSR